MSKKNQSITHPSSQWPPIVAVLGHVDHGKTSLLDAIRKTDVAAGEHGGITQAIGAYQIEVVVKEGRRKITFIDTPGHEAFTKMRSRGVTAADIAILVVACDDGVMPQTKEAISHIKTAAIPYIVALTKSDLAAAQPEKVKQQLVKAEVNLEGFGGDVPVVTLSSKTGKGITDLLEVILLVSQMHDVAADSQGQFLGVIIEAKRDRRKGPLATVVVKNGQLAIGDELLAETVGGKVKALFTEREMVKEALPGMPVEILGFSNVPAVGARVTKKKETGEQIAFVGQVKREIDISSSGEPGKKRLPVILKADTEGSLEAILQSVPKEDARIIHAASGDPTEGDVLLAKASKAIILGFNTNASGSIMKLAGIEGVIIKNYRLIYKLLGELEEVIALFKEGKAQELILGRAEILALFPYDNKTVAGCKVLEGRVVKGDKIRVERNGDIVGEARIVSLRRGKEEIGRVDVASECGILLSTQLDFTPGDVILSVR